MIFIVFGLNLSLYSHALESFTALPYNLRSPCPPNPINRPAYQGSNPISDVWSRHALKIVAKYLKRYVEWSYVIFLLFIEYLDTSQKIDFWFLSILKVLYLNVILARYEDVCVVGRCVMREMWRLAPACTWPVCLQGLALAMQESIYGN